MKYTFILVLFLFSFSAGSLFGSDPIEIIYSEYPPLTSSSMEYNGLIGKIIHYAYASVDKEVVFSRRPFSRLKHEIVQGSVPIACISTRSIDNEDLPFVEAVNILEGRVVLFYLTDRFEEGIVFNKPEDLRNYNFGMMRGMGTEEDVMATEPEYSNDIKSLFLKLYNNRLDVIAIMEYTGRMYIEQLYPDEIERFASVETPLSVVPLTVVFSKRHPGYQEALTSFLVGLEKIKKNGLYQQIVDEFRYYNK